MARLISAQSISLIMIGVIASTLGDYKECYGEPSVCFTAKTEHPGQGNQSSLLQTLSSARSWCTKNSASLVKIRDENVQDAVTQFAQDNSSSINSDIILDASLSVTSNWRWINGNVAAHNIQKSISKRNNQANCSMFDGHGYVILPKDNFNPTKKSLVKFSFMTFASEGLMFYMGAPGKDFLSIEMRDGKVVYQFELGFGPAVLISTSRYNDGRWHVLSANRIAQDGILKVDQNTVASARSPGNLKSLDIDNNFLYFGGYNGTLAHNSTITGKRFKGCIRDIQIGSSNRLINNSNYVCVKPEAKEKLREKKSSVMKTRQERFSHNVQKSSSRRDNQVNCTKFGGNVYVILPKDKFNPTTMSLVKFSFMTFASEGLMFYMGAPGKDFLSIEMRDGKVLYQFELGSGRAVLLSSQRYNDGRWHVVTANRVYQDGILKVDYNTVASARSLGNLKIFDIGNDFLYFGGFNGTLTHNATVTDKRFKGCMKGIQIGSSNRYINNSNYVRDRQKHSEIGDNVNFHYGYVTRGCAGQIDFDSDMAFRKRNFICNSDSKDSECNKGIILSGRCYKMYNDSLTWFDARSRCLKENSDLAIFEPNFNFSQISQMLEDGEYWIGLTKETWNWGNGEKMNYYNWEDGQPNPFDGECLCLNKNSGKWKTCPCDRSYRFICIQGFKENVN